MIIRRLIGIGLLAGLTAFVFSQPSRAGEGIAEGASSIVEWIPDAEKARAMARDTGRPILVRHGERLCGAAFMEVHRTITGIELLLEAIQQSTVPAAGEHHRSAVAETPSLSATVSLLSADDELLTDTVDFEAGPGGIAIAMVAALEKLDRPAPGYLALLAEEAQARANGVERATFAMHCFWVGEGVFAKIPGVVSTVPGFLDGAEVVEVEFDPTRVNYASLVTSARGFECASRVFARTDSQAEVAAKIVPAATQRSDDDIRPDGEPKYYLSRTPYRAIPMTDLQAARVNARIGDGKSPDNLLSPRQLALLAKVRAAEGDPPNRIEDNEVARTWRSATTKLAK